MSVQKYAGLSLRDSDGNETLKVEVAENGDVVINAFNVGTCVTVKLLPSGRDALANILAPFQTTVEDEGSV